MEIANLGFIALMTVGFVNVISFWKPDMDSKMKIGLSVLFAFVLTFVPAELGNMLADKIKQALEVSLLATGGYKIAQKAGGM